MTKKFEIIEHEILYSGFFRMEKYRLKHTLFAGGWSEEISREVFSRGSGAAVILYDPNTDQVILIEQIRAGALANPYKAWLIEIVAGGIEEGETAVDVAYRETLEETGCQIQDLYYINEFYTTPGGVSERITLFCGKVDSTQVKGIHGLDAEDEDILVHCVDFETAYQMVDTNEIESAIPIIAIQWLALNKHKILAKWLSR